MKNIEEIELIFRQQGIKTFLIESWRIEGLGADKITEGIIQHTYGFLERKQINLTHVLDLATAYTPKAILRCEKGMNVQVGNYVPPVGGPEIASKLNELIDLINQNKIDPWEGHIEFESLHPFLDGNGRTGRAVWAWHTFKNGENPFIRPFLHSFYYSTLNHIGK